jgi:hypothetical protein
MPRSAVLRRFRSRAELARTRQAESTRQLVLQIDVSDDARREVLRALDTLAAPEPGKWIFIMIGPQEYADIGDWLDEHSALPRVASRLWRHLPRFIDRDTGEVLATRDELAAAVRAPSNDISRIMSELVAVGAISRRMVRVAGMRGRGAVRYSLNPWVGSHLGQEARARAQAVTPKPLPAPVVRGRRAGAPGLKLVEPAD